MKNTRIYIYKTNYFKRPWTWIKRMLIFLFLMGAMLYMDMMYSGNIVIEFFLLMVCAGYIVLKPKDDLAIDNRFLYHFRRSIQPGFSKTTKYDIREIESIKVGGIYSPHFEIMELLGTGFSNSIEIIFKDNSSVTLNLQIYKKDLIMIVSKIKNLTTGPLTP